MTVPRIWTTVQPEGGASMATLTVWKFDSAGGADGAVVILERLAKQELITIHDAAAGTWPEGKKKPKTHQLNSLAGAGAAGGAFWGLLFGLLFFIPLLGLAVGVAGGGLRGSSAAGGRCGELLYS